MNPVILKHKILSLEEKYYSKDWKVFSQDDIDLLETSKRTVSAWSHNPWTGNVDHKLYKGAPFLLPFTEFKIIKYQNCSLRSQFPRPSGLGQYHSPVMNLNNKYEGELFSAENYGTVTFPHFIQDSLPMIGFCKDILKDNKDIKILLSYQNKTVLNYIWEKFGLQNEILFQPDNISNDPYPSPNFNFFESKNCYIFDSNFEVPVESWNTFFYEEINDSFLKNVKTEDRYVIYCPRYRNRRIFNEDKLILALQHACKKIGKEFIIYESEKFSFDQTIHIFNNLYAMVAANGGVCYNAIFARKNIKVFEFVFTQQLNNIYPIASALDAEYYGLPVNSHVSHAGFYVSDEHIDGIAARL
jgi:hypothetical protein